MVEKEIVPLVEEKPTEVKVTYGNGGMELKDGKVHRREIVVNNRDGSHIDVNDEANAQNKAEFLKTINNVICTNEYMIQSLRDKIKEYQDEISSAQKMKDAIDQIQ